MTDQIRVHLDYETFSKADLKKVGGAAYARHPTTEILMASWAYAEGDAKQWDQNDGTMPQELIDILENKDGKYLVHAQNANFEIMITIWAGKHYGLDVPDETERDGLREWLKNWRCTMVMGMGLSMPGALIDQNKILGVSDEQSKQASDGKRLIQLFCLPRRPTKADPSPRATSVTHPDFWAAFLEYNRMDVIAERANYKKLICYNPMPQVEWDMWHLDQLINLTGLPIDLDLVDAALAVNKEVTEILIGEFKKLTGLSNPNSRKQMLSWLHRETEYPAGYGLKKDDVNRVLRDETISPKLRRALELRQATSKTSISKFTKLLFAAGGEHGDGKLRGAFQFAGAQRTRRWGGRIFQPQNLPRGILKRPEEMEAAIAFVKARDVETLIAMYGSAEAIPDILSSIIRNAVCAPEGKTLTVADLASIETIMTWWAAGATNQLEKVRQGIDAYKDYGSKLLSKPYDEITKSERTYSKPAVLGCFGPETPVLTDRGWVRIVDVKNDDKLWDGESWVTHGGVIYQGKKAVIDQYGVLATPDHLILSHGNWVEWGDLTGLNLKSAIQSGRGGYSNFLGATGCASALVGQSSGLKATTLTPVKPISATPVGRNNAHRSGQPQRVSGSNNETTTALREESMRNEADVKTPKTKRSKTTVAVALSSISKQLKTLSATSLRLMGGQRRTSRLIGLTTTATTSGATCDSQTALGIRRIPGLSKALSTEDNATPTQSSTAGLHHDTNAHLRSHAKPNRVKAQSKLSQSKATAEADTYDILNAGPRSRFTILTDVGPLIVHNCCYRLGGPGLVAYAESMGVKMTKKEGYRAVDIYRDANPEVVALWDKLENAFRECLTSGKNVVVDGKFRFRRKKPCVFIDLPGGRSLCYVQPKILPRTIKFEDRETGKPIEKNIMSVTYMGVDQLTRKWVRMDTHGGKLLENIIQAIARDVLRDAMLTLDKLDMMIVGHVHDEILAVTEQDEKYRKTVEDAMTNSSPWCADAPLGASSFQSPFYMKD